MPKLCDRCCVLCNTLLAFDGLKRGNKWFLAQTVRCMAPEDRETAGNCRGGRGEQGKRGGSLFIDQADSLNRSCSDKLFLAAFCGIDTNKDPVIVSVKDRIGSVL